MGCQIVKTAIQTSRCQDSEPASSIVVSSIGEAWIAIQQEIIEKGKNIDDVVEVLNLSFNTVRVRLPDPILDRWADKSHIMEMKKVFNTTEKNRFGHSYRGNMVGPVGGDPIEAIFTTLSSKISSRQAVITLPRNGKGKTPCVNVLQFLVRDDCLVVTYFARGQDIFNKFYADALCIFDFAQTVRQKIPVRQISIRGTIASAHIYRSDIPRALATITSVSEEFGCI